VLACAVIDGQAGLAGSLSICVWQHKLWKLSTTVTTRRLVSIDGTLCAFWQVRPLSPNDRIYPWVTPAYLL